MPTTKSEGAGNYAIQVWDGMKWRIEDDEMTLSYARQAVRDSVVFGLKARIVTDSGLIVE